MCIRLVSPVYRTALAGRQNVHCPAASAMEEPNTREHILLVDDDLGLCELVSQYLSSRGYIVHTEEDGEAGLERAAAGDITLIILDVMLPGMSGFDVLRIIRGGPLAAIPVVILTAHGDEIDRIVGLELGADDYLPKPFNPRELLARIRAVLRRGTVAVAPPPPIAVSAPATDVDRLVNGDMVMEISARNLWIGEERIDITAAEFDMLHLLLREVGRVVKREVMARDALGQRLLPFDRSLDLHMSRLRRKLGPLSNGGERFRTVRSVGYMLEKAGGNP